MKQRSALTNIVMNGARGAITVTSVAVIAAISVLNYYAHRTAGANHYAYYFKVEYQKGLLNAGNTRILGVVALIIAALCVARLVSLARGGRLSYAWGILAGVEAVVCGVLLALVAFTPLFAELVVWVFFILAVGVLELLAVALTMLSSRAPQNSER